MIFLPLAAVRWLHHTARRSGRRVRGPADRLREVSLDGSVGDQGPGSRLGDDRGVLR